MIFDLTNRNGVHVRVWATELITKCYKEKLISNEKEGFTKANSLLFIKNLGKKIPKQPSQYQTNEGKTINYYYAFSFKTVSL